MELAFVREGEGGFPLLLLHGWPETKRIWWRNIAPLAEAGFEVIAPDLRGFGDSGLGAGRPLRRRRPGARHGGARCGELGPRALRGLRRRLRRRGRAGPVAALRRARRAAGPLQHDPAGAAGRPARGARARCGWRPTTSCARGCDADGLAAELDTPGQAPPLRGADVRAALLGGARAPSSPTTWTS